MWSIPIYGISIRPKRKANFLKRIGTLRRHVKVVLGVNGATLKPRHSCAPGVTLTRGQIGCFCSHRQIWKKILKAGHRYACIFEDDVSFRPGFVQRTLQAVTYLSKHKPQWDVIYLGRNPKNRHNKGSAGPGLVVSGESWGMFAYLVSRRGVRKLLAHAKVQKFTCPCDVLLSNLGLQGHLNCYALTPCVCGYQRLGSDTRGIK